MLISLIIGLYFCELIDYSVALKLKINLEMQIQQLPTTDLVEEGLPLPMCMSMPTAQLFHTIALVPILLSTTIQVRLLFIIFHFHTSFIVFLSFLYYLFSLLPLSMLFICVVEISSRTVEVKQNTITSVRAKTAVLVYASSGIIDGNSFTGNI